MKNKILVIAVLILVLILFVVYTQSMIKKSKLPNLDFEVNYIAGKYFFTAPEKFYRQPYNGWFTYQPFIALLYSPFHLIYPDITKAKKLWTILNYLITVLILIIFKKYFYNKLDIYFVLAAVFILFFKPLLDNYKWGNIKNILLFLYFIFFIFYINKNDILSGIIVGLLISFSIQPLILLLYFLIKKNMKIFITSMIVFLITMFLPAIFIGSEQIIKYYLTVLPNLFFQGSSAMPYIQSIDAMCQRFFLSGNECTINLFGSNFLGLHLAKIIKLVILCFTTYILFLKRKSNDKYLLEFNLIFITMLLIHSINWEYHYTILIFSFAIFVKYFSEIKSDSKFSDISKLTLNRLFIFFLFLIIWLRLPYDNPVFTQNKYLLIFTNIKLLALFGLYIINCIFLKHT